MKKLKRGLLVSFEGGEGTGKSTQIKLLHENIRAGKSAAENRSLKYVETPIVIFSDANTLLPEQAVREIVKHYSDPKVGAVSGEKKIYKKE